MELLYDNAKETKLLREVNNGLKDRVKRIDNMIEQLYNKRLITIERITRNTEIITSLEGYECILTSESLKDIRGKKILIVSVR